MVETVNSRISVFNFMIKKKHKRKYLQADVIFHVIKDISNLPYSRKTNRGRNIQIGEGEIVLDVLNIPENLNENGTEVDFFIGKETRENYPTRDNRGDFHTRTLPEEENLCFKTHGRFIFRKINNLWVCCLLFERRFHTIGLSRLVQYLEKIKPDYSFDSSAISSVPNIIKKINKVTNLKSVIIKDYDLDFAQPNDGIGTILVRDRESKQFSGLNIEIAILQGNSTLDKIKNLFSALYGTNKQFNEANLREFALETDLVLVGRTNLGATYNIDLFEDLVLYKIKILQLESREINTSDFFDKLTGVVTNKEKDKLFKLSRKFYNSIQIEDTLQNS